MKIPRALALLAVVGAGLSLFVTARQGVECDFLALIDSSAGGEKLKPAAAAMARSAHFLVKADSEAAAHARLAELGVQLPPNATKLAAVLNALAPYARGFLSPTVKGQLERGDFAVVRDAAAARMFSPIPPVLPLDRDPFLLVTDYVLEMSAPKGEWVMVNAELTLGDALGALKAVKGADDVRCSGAPFHTAVASERSKREINILSGISLFCVVLFGWLLTRSFRFVPVLMGALAAAFCVATAALFAVFPKPHLMTFVFGTTLIGLSVDYVYHAMTARGSIAKPLTFSFLSTAMCFLPLLFSSVGVMRQMAVFTVAGLTTVYAGVLAFGGGGDASPAGGPESAGCAVRWSKWRVAAASLVRMGLLLATVLCLALRVWVVPPSRGVDISRFYRPDPYLAEGERIAAEATGGAGFIPSAAEQRRNAKLVQRLYEAEGANLCAMTGVPAKVLALPGKFEPFDPKGAMESLFGAWNREVDGLLTISLLVLCVVLATLFRRECLDFILPILCAYCATEGLLLFMGETFNFFARIGFFIFIGLGLDYCVFRWHARQNPHRPTENAVWYSFLTSLVAFGLLSFTEFAVTRLMGITLAFGLAVAYFAAKLCVGAMGKMPPASQSPARSPQLPTPWHEQSEQCASRFWALFMWYSYAWFGKAFQKLIFVIGMPVIYLFARSPRAALRNFYGALAECTGRPCLATHGRLFRHLLGFAWGVMDKTDACTLKKNPPRMGVRDDAGWRAFRSLMDAGKGAFILCSHVGVVGVLPALPDALGLRKPPKVHAFQQMGHDAVFMRVFMKHFDHARLELHAVEEIGVETAVEMQEAIRRGELVIMAGDRTSAGSKSVLRHRFLGHNCVWPKGAFTFARLMEAPVFAVTCICTGWNRYEVHMAEVGGDGGTGQIPSMLARYVAFLERETLAYPGQWYQFYDFFSA